MHRTSRSTAFRSARILLAALAMGLLMAACAEPEADESADADQGDQADASSDSEGDDNAGEDTGGDITLEYLTFSAAPDHLEDLDAIVDAFEAEHDGITIDVQTAPFDDYFTQLQTQIAGGQAPDTFELNYENFVSYADAGTLLDLAAAAPDAVDPSVYYDEAYDVFQHDGTQFGLPASFSVVVLIYNKDLFDEAGLDYPDRDWDWEDERAAAEQLTDADAGVWGTFQPVSFFEFFKVLDQNGGSFFNDDLTATTFAEPEGVEAADWLIDKVGDVMPSEAEMGGQDDAALFQSGDLAMWHNGIWQFAGLADADFEWDVVVEPGNVEDSSHFFANAVAASADTEHPEEAASWLQYLAASDVTVEQRLASDWELPAVADEGLLAPYLEQEPPANRQAVFDALDNVVVPPVISDQQQMQDAVSEALEQAVLGQVSTEEALERAADRVDGLLR